MAARKQKTAENQNAAPMTLADIGAAIDREAKRLSQSETALAVNASDREAEAARVDSLEKLDALDINRQSLQRIEAKRKASQQSEAEKARSAADRKTAQIIPQRIGGDQRKLFKSIKGAIDVLARDVPAFEALQDANQLSILSLRDGNRGRVEPLMTAARNLSLTLQIRESMKVLHVTRLLSPWIAFNVPNPPNRQPGKGESHASAEASADWFLSRTIDDAFDDCVERVQGHLNFLLGPQPEPVDPGDITSWHGRSEAERPDSFVKQMAAGNLAIDDSDQKARQAQRVKDSAKPVVRDGKGNVVAESLLS